MGADSVRTELNLGGHHTFLGVEHSGLLLWLIQTEIHTLSTFFPTYVSYFQCCTLIDTHNFFLLISERGRKRRDITAHGVSLHLMCGVTMWFLLRKGCYEVRSSHTVKCYKIIFGLIHHNSIQIVPLFHTVHTFFIPKNK